MRSEPITTGQQSPAGQYNSLLADAYAASTLLVHQQLGKFTLPNQPADGDTVVLTINGTAVTLTAKTTIGSTPGNVARGASASAFAANVLALLQRPDITTSLGVALSSANITLMQYVGFILSGTTITVYQVNNATYAPLTSFSASVSTAGDAWATNTMALYVQPGNFWINGTRVAYSGGVAPTITAPSGNPRIDLVVIDNTGTVSVVTGSEGASPAVPTYPSNKLILAEIYNRVGETKLLDYDDSSNGYVQKDVRPFLQYVQSPGAVAADFIPDANNARNLGSSSFQWNIIYAAQVLQNGAGVASAKFGGTGADGALTIASGTTTINLGSAAMVVKNYTSISITSTGQLAFSTPHAAGTWCILKSQGNVVVTASGTSIDMSGMGASGGAGGAVNATGSGGTAPNFALDQTTPAGAAGVGAGGGGGGGAAGAVIANKQFYTNVTVGIYNKAIRLIPGAGGGGGGGGGALAGAAGGKGGGALYIECGGAFNFTTGTISVAGKPGTNATTDGSNKSGGSGGGGAGGIILILYTTLTANSGTVNNAGGDGGTSNTSGNGSTAGGGGGGGGAWGGAGGGGGPAGSNGGGGATGAGGGGAGGSDAGAAKTGGTGGATDNGIVLANTEFS